MLMPLAVSYGEDVLSLEAAKAHLRVDADDDAEDAVIGAFRDAAITAVELYTKVMLGSATRTWQGRFASRMVLGTGPVTEVTAISYLDPYGDAISLSASDWRLALGELVPGIGKSWPMAAQDDGVVTVTFTAGYSDETRPGNLVQAVKLMLSHLYENRGDDVSELSPGARAWCDLTRLPTI
ncbi:head-tail connector protein [Sphingomonas colocasiae]|uniref:Phage gp6-like head-tail connector protein n=1 Tax=Sphingomonas colocasiae TaxID=1848973 RepID=A0ABS7PXT2_9SPHN|nr:hypothetical protein [Sphingomonas colocasiae]MBY8826116.1 hypothetical protein [Sphingomonas colocasiae]